MKTVAATVAAKMERLFGQRRDSFGKTASQDFTVCVDGTPTQRPSSANAPTTLRPPMAISQTVIQMESNEGRLAKYGCIFSCPGSSIPDLGY